VELLRFIDLSRGADEQTTNTKALLCYVRIAPPQSAKLREIGYRYTVFRIAIAHPLRYLTEDIHEVIVSHFISRSSSLYLDNPSLLTPSSINIDPVIR